MTCEPDSSYQTEPYLTQPKIYYRFDLDETLERGCAKAFRKEYCGKYQDLPRKERLNKFNQPHLLVGSIPTKHNQYQRIKIGI